VLFDDETKEMAKEIVRTNAIDRVNMALDYFDASINRVSAWTVGFRSWQKALLSALCTPSEDLKKLQNSANWTELMVRQEEIKMLPFGDIWSEYCEQCGTSEDGWFEEVKKYEKEVLSKRA
jgi:L-rhamnose isomerase